MEFKDYYKVLGVERGASEKEIKAAYRKLARRYHPDVNPGDKSAEQKFTEINQAYEVLADEEERKKYEEIADYVRSGKRRPPGRHDEGDLEDLFGAGAGVGPDFFEHFFGGRRHSQATPRPGNDLHAEVAITLEEALHGTQRRLSMERQEPCPDCAGLGVRERQVCPACRGLGRVLRPATLDVKIPAGATRGSSIRLRGRGEAGAAGGPAGDLILRIELAPHDRYEVKGHDLHRDLKVSVFDAVAGGEVEFEGLRGRLSLRLPPETQNGTTFRLKEQGLPRTGSRAPGDLYVRVSLQIPTGLSAAERDAFLALRDRLGRVEV
ncbi:MAG: J domain-containing protein [Armatimonadetes bacterium]|nr:J domain-containing protein [Armatimonadota bacterium]